jgi:hypothetical protein
MHSSPLTRVMQEASVRNMTIETVCLIGTIVACLIMDMLGYVDAHPRFRMFLVVLYYLNWFALIHQFVVWVLP